MNKTKKFVMALLITGLALFAMTGIAVAEEYFVSTNGNNGDPGTVNSPFRTIGHGVDQCEKGDTVYVRSGTYTGNFKIENSGTSSNYNTLTNYKSENVIITNDNIYDHGIIVHASYWVIDGFEITNTWHPVMVCNGQHNIEMKNLECYYNGYSLILNDGSHDLLVEDCTFYDPYSESTNFIGLRGEDDDISHHITIRDCDFDGCIHNSINAYTSKANEHYDGLTDVLIEGCSFSNGRQVAIFTNWMGITRMTVRDCHFDHYARGIQAVMRDCLIEDCTVEDHGFHFVYTQGDADSWDVTVQDITAHSGSWGNSAPCVTLHNGHDFHVHNVKATGDFSCVSIPKQTDSNEDKDTEDEITPNEDEWIEEYIGEDSDEGKHVTTNELQHAINHWLEDIPVRGHVMGVEDIQMLYVLWLESP